MQVPIRKLSRFCNGTSQFFEVFKYLQVGQSVIIALTLVFPQAGAFFSPSCNPEWPLKGILSKLTHQSISSWY